MIKAIIHYKKIADFTHLDIVPPVNNSWKKSLLKVIDIEVRFLCRNVFNLIIKKEKLAFIRFAVMFILLRQFFSCGDLTIFVLQNRIQI